MGMIEIFFNKKDEFFGNFKFLSKWLYIYCYRFLLRIFVKDRIDI